MSDITVPEGYIPTGEIDGAGNQVFVAPPPAPLPQTDSIYFKISRAINGDDWWNTRLGLAFEMAGVENSRENVLAVTKDVVASISCTVQGHVDTSEVTDDVIDLAITKLTQDV